MEELESEEMLLDLAVNVMKNAYVPYSNFKVGVSIQSTANRYYVGCNVENAAYPQGSCAETGAISAMVAGGCHLISRILVVSEGPKLIVPCGGCRQKLLEFSNSETRVLLANESLVKQNLSIDELLPLSFDNSFLNF